MPTTSTAPSGRTRTMPGLGLCDGFLLVSHLAPTEAEALDGIGPGRPALRPRCVPTTAAAAPNRQAVPQRCAV